MSLHNFFSKEQTPAEQVAGFQVDLSAQIKAESEVALANVQVEQLVSMGEALDNIAEGIQASIEDGGLSREAAAFVNIAAQNALSGSGVAVRMPNMQSFSGGQSDRQQATSICMQSVKEKMSAVAGAIIKAIRNAMAKIREWFRSFMNNIPKLIKMVKALQEKADAVTGSIETKDFEVSAGVANTLRLNNKVDTAGFADALKVLTEVSKSNYDDAGTFKKLSDAATEALDAVVDESKIEGMLEKSLDVYIKIADSTPGQASKEDAAMAAAIAAQELVSKADAPLVDISASPRLIGDRTVWFAFPKKPGEGATTEETIKAFNLLGKAGCRMADAAKGQKKIESAQKVKTISSSDVSSVCDKLITLLEIFEKNDKDFTAAEKAKDAILTSGEKAAKAIDGYKAEDGEDKEAVLAGKKVAKAVTGSLIKFSGNLDGGMRIVMGHSVAVTKAMIGVLETSIKNHK